MRTFRAGPVVTGMITQITLLYEDLPELQQDKLRTDLRVLAGKNGLPVSGTSEVGDDVVRLSCLPFEIVVEVCDTALAASNFSGTLSANLRSSQRGHLAKVIADHTAHVQVSIRDTGKSQALRESILPSAQAGLQDMRRATIFAQDVARMVMQHMPPAALLWHPSNQLALPGGLSDQEYGRLHLPICMRLRCTSAALQNTVVVNMAQDIEGAAAFLGRPLHIMALSLSRFETMQLAVAFLDRMLEGEARPISGAVFRDQRGTRVKVIDEPASAELPAGLIALVEIGSEESQKPAKLSSSVKGSREQVETRARSRVRSRDLAADQGAKPASPLSEEQMEAVKDGLKAAARAGFIERPDIVSKGLPSAERLKELRERAASKQKNG